MFSKSAAAAVAILVLAACGGGGSTLPGADAPTRASSAVFSIAIPPKATGSAARSPKYVSPNTQSLTIAVNGSVPTLTQDLTSSSPGCTTSGGTTTCTVTVGAPIGNDTFEVILYSGAGATGSQLASGSINATIGPETTSVPITLDGVVSSVCITLANTTPLIGSAVSIPVSITAKDPSGATIISPGGYSPEITLTNSDDSGHTTLSTAIVPAPGTTVTLQYDGSPALTSATISAVITDTITRVCPATLTPQFG